MQQRFYQQCEGIFYMKIIVTITPENMVTDSLLSPFCLFLESKNKYKIFSKLLVWSREKALIFVWSESCSTWSMPNLIEFYKGIFLHVIPVRVIVLCYKVVFFYRQMPKTRAIKEPLKKTIIINIHRLDLGKSK